MTCSRLRQGALLYLSLLIWVAVFAELLASAAPIIAIHGERAPLVDVLPAVLRARTLEAMSPRELEREFADATGLWPLLPEDPARASPERANQVPSLVHPAGTDADGVDVLSRTIHGARSVLLLIAVVSLLAGPLGLAWGLLAGGGARALDFLLTRGIEVSGLWPSLVLLALLRSIDGAPGPFSLVLVLSAVQCLRVAQVVRAESLRIEQRAFVQGAFALGASRLRVLFRHVLPHVAHPLWVSVVTGAAQVVVAEAALTVLGLGLPRSMPSWGAQLGEVGSVGVTALVLPALGTCLTTAALHVVADALDDTLSPRGRCEARPAQS